MTSSSASLERFRKRTARTQTEHQPVSGVLRRLRDHVQAGDHATALAELDQILAYDLPLDQKAKALSLAGDSLLKQGRFAEAATTYATVKQLVPDDLRAWLRPAFGEVRSLLKNVQISDALNYATTILATITTAGDEFDQFLSQADVALVAQGEILLAGQPPRVSVVASRLGHLFFCEGELASAKFFFQQALEHDPNGASRARLALAVIASREGNYGVAARLASDALRIGKFGAKTLSAWRLLIDSSANAGIDPLTDPSVNGLAQARPSVRARAVVAIAQSLRKRNDPRWTSVAAWLRDNAESFPIEAAEIRKLDLAKARAAGSPAGILKHAAQSLLQTPRLAPAEWLSAVAHVVYASSIDEQLDIDSLLQDGLNRFGLGREARLRRALGGICRRAKRTELATSLLQSSLAAAPIGTPDWGRTLFALARLQNEQGDHLGAAANYWTYSQNTALPHRFRVLAVAQWLRQMSAANQSGAVEQAQSQIQAVLPQITDYELVLDLSRQLLDTELDKEFSLQVFQRGRQLALQAFHASGHPAWAATVLFKFCRRANDHQQYDAIISTWTGLSVAKRQWLWSASADYWNYIEVVLRAYRDSNRFVDAEQLAVPLLSDSSTPPHGYAMIAVCYAAMKRNAGDLTSMFTIYEKMAQVAPSHEWTSAAYYWLGLRSQKQGNFGRATDYAEKMLLVLGHDWGMYWKRNMVASALCLKANLDFAGIPRDTGIRDGTLRMQLEAMQADLTRISA